MPENENENVTIIYDADFDEKNLVSEGPVRAERPEKKEPTQFTISLSPTKIFFAGLFVGVLVMAIPLTYAMMRDGGGSKSARGNEAPANTNTPPSAPSAPSAPTPGNVKPVSKDDHVRGSKNAEVIMIEYSDFECPFCKRFHPTIKQAFDEYDGKVAWVYRHFPLSFHANAQKQAEATECAADVGGNEGYWKYVDALFDRTTSGGTGFALENLTPLAKELGINEKKFKDCLDGGKFVERVKKDLQEGQEAGVDGTPGTILVAKNGKKALVPGAVSYEEMKSSIDTLLAN